jgi:hypothetical protein
MWMEAAVAYFKVPFKQLPKETGENHKNVE